MVSITKKTVRGKTYYYARECRRVAGKPKIVWQKYLGKAEDIVAALSQPQAASPQTALELWLAAQIPSPAAHGGRGR